MVYHYAILEGRRVVCFAEFSILRPGSDALHQANTIHTLSKWGDQRVGRGLHTFLPCPASGSISAPRTTFLHLGTAQCLNPCLAPGGSFLPGTALLKCGSDGHLLAEDPVVLPVTLRAEPGRSAGHRTSCAVPLPPCKLAPWARTTPTSSLSPEPGCC